MQPREEIEIESGDGHDGIIEILLPRNQNLGRPVVDYDKVFIVRGGDGLEEAWRRGKEREVLDVRIVSRVVSGKMMDVVRALPPPDGEATAKICDEHSNESIRDKILGDSQVAGVMSREHDLMLREN